MKKMEWSKEKIAGYVSKGWSLSYDKTNDRFKLQKWIKGKVKSYSLPKQFNEFCQELKKELSQVREVEDVEEELEGSKSKKLKKSSDHQRPGTGREITLEALDKSHAKIVQNVTERVSWFADVLNEIGFYATLLAMQVAKVPPEELYTKIAEFKNPQSFAAFVKEYLNALFQAKEKAREIIKYRKKLMALDVKLALLEEVAEQLKQQRDEAIMNLYIVSYAAASTMDRDQLREYLQKVAISQFFATQANWQKKDTTTTGALSK